MKQILATAAAIITLTAGAALAQPASPPATQKPEHASGCDSRRQQHDPPGGWCEQLHGSSGKVQARSGRLHQRFCVDQGQGRNLARQGLQIWNRP